MNHIYAALAKAIPDGGLYLYAFVTGPGRTGLSKVPPFSGENAVIITIGSLADVPLTIATCKAFLQKLYVQDSNETAHSNTTHNKRIINAIAALFKSVCKWFSVAELSRLNPLGVKLLSGIIVFNSPVEYAILTTQENNSNGSMDDYGCVKNPLPRSTYPASIFAAIFATFANSALYFDSVDVWPKHLGFIDKKMSASMGESPVFMAATALNSLLACVLCATTFRTNAQLLLRLFSHENRDILNYNPSLKKIEKNASAYYKALGASASFTALLYTLLSGAVSHTDLLRWGLLPVGFCILFGNQKAQTALFNTAETRDSSLHTAETRDSSSRPEVYRQME